MRVDIGVFAHNEKAGIAAMVAELGRQDIAQNPDVRVLILANGCTDDTVTLARTAAHGTRIEVIDLPLGGKSRTWNRFVHNLSRPDADVLLFCDADIELPLPDTLSRLVGGLMSRPDLHAFNSRPVKDIAHHPHGLTRLDRLIAMAGGTLDDWKTAICGQLYAMPAGVARRFHLPIGLPVEDGFLRAMILTNALTSPENLTLIDGAEVFHIYASERTIPALIKHQTRIVIGSAINAACFAALRDTDPNVRHQTLSAIAKDESWLARTIRARLPRFPFGYVPLHFLTKRAANLARAPRDLLRPKRLFVLIAGFGFDLIVYLNAQFRMTRGTGAGHW
ncbi:MAG: glycosyltransferase family A protein [Paracoccaceae bacterium]